jgi:hypothetical protein
VTESQRALGTTRLRLGCHYNATFRVLLPLLLSSGSPWTKMVDGLVFARNAKAPHKAKRHTIDIYRGPKRMLQLVMRGIVGPRMLELHNLPTLELTGRVHAPEL